MTRGFHFNKGLTTVSPWPEINYFLIYIFSNPRSLKFRALIARVRNINGNIFLELTYRVASIMPLQDN